MTSLSSYLTGGIVFVLALDFLAPPGGTGLKFDIWPTVISPTPVSQQHADKGQMVDRRQKSDRLPISIHVRKNVPDVTPTATIEERPIPQLSPMPAYAVPVGCDPAFSPLMVAKGGNFPSRCMTSIGESRKLAGLQ